MPKGVYERKVQAPFKRGTVEYRRWVHKRLRDKNPERVRGYKLKQNFGISIDEYNQLLKSQNDCCAICKKHKSEFKRALAVDHSHTNGHIRGLLCANCNTGLGKFKDNSSFLLEAIEYLKKSGV